ncbi:xanthine dehydrogenase family protein molybdopterin-binding subunit [Helicovermis profundi]|uniref:Xanthine dehydrogenase subunit D n=1 Tax=Helicovermis profundi TaxID=3065157 RepID=A0AAU9E256_9FIRM|nr:xanthine dehydrogenase subunit D [Clostridia bacterium S502]
MNKFKTIGKSVVRRDAKDKLRGRALYPQDIYMEDMVFGYTLRSTKAHAKFKMDISEAEKYEGVLTILVAKDVLSHNSHGVVFKDHEVFCSKKVRRIGDPLAFIVASTDEIAREAAKYIKVEYEELPAVFDPYEAMKKDAPRVHDDKDNLIYHYKCNRGDIKKGFEESFIVVENEYKTNFADHVFLQVESGLSYLEEDGTLVVIASSQYPHFDRLEVSDAIGIEEEKIKIINPVVGGAFGGREDITLQIHLALATLKLKRPVKATFTREESFYAHSKRHPITMKVKSGVDKNGKLLAFEAEIVGDTGAYASWAINVMRKAGIHVTGPYFIPNVKVDSYAVYTNNPFSGAMRGFGATQVPVAYEQQMDILAEKLGLSPEEIRRRNMYRNESITANGQVLVESVPLDECLDKVEEEMSKKEFVKDENSSIKKGRGLAISWYGTGYGNGFPDVSVATVELRDDGNINLRVGAAEVGQGARTIMPQLCAEVVGVNPLNVNMISFDTSTFEDSGTAAATRQTYNTGNAVKLASESFVKRIFEVARDILGLNSTVGFFIEEGVVSLKMLPSKKVSFKEIAEYMNEKNEILSARETFTAQTCQMNPETGEGAPYWPYTFNAFTTEVEVDTSTGRVEVKEAWCAQDVGRAINPKLCEGQIEGGYVMGLGYTLYEDLNVKKGAIKNNKFAKYIIPTSMDIPKINSYLIEDPENTAPYGAKGIGEPVMVPVAPAILNAIYDAIGVRIYIIPATPDIVLKAIKDAEKNNNNN